MEQKLAQFRARRRAESAVKSSDCTGTTAVQTAVKSSDCATDQQPPNMLEELHTSAQTASASELKAVKREEDELADEDTRPLLSGEKKHVEDGPVWLLDSALGRWLKSRQFAFTNLTLLKVLLWLVLLGLFAELGFGLPFFMISLFYWLYEGLRSPAERKPGEMSAYSVFNPDCQPILGTITAEQLEGEMGYSMLAHR